MLLPLCRVLMFFCLRASLIYPIYVVLYTSVLTGGIVSWGGLGLGDLRPEWLEPTFLGRAPRGWQVSGR